MNSSKYYPAGE